LLSITPDPGISTELAQQWTQFCNTRLRYAWSIWDWPELLVTQERAFRPVWRNDQNYFANDELYFLPTTSYYKAIRDVIQGDPPTDTNFWAPITQVDKYIGYDQMGQQPIGEIFGVYNINPRLFPSLQPPGIKFRPSQYGVDVSPFSGPTVFINFKIPFQKLTTDPWVQATYQYGQSVFWTDGNCYAVGVASTTAPPSDTTQWYQIPLPSVLAEYVKTAAAGDAADDQAAEQTLLAESEEYLHQEVNRLMGQGQAHYYSLRRPQRYHFPYGLGGFWWSVSGPWTGGFVSTLTDALYSPLPQDRRLVLADELGDAVVTETGQEILVQ